MSRCEAVGLADATPIALPDGRWALWSARVQLPIKMGSSQADLLSEVSRALGSLDRAHAAFAQAVADEQRWERLLASLPPDDVRALKRRVGAPAPHPPLLTARPMAPGLSALVQPDPAQPAATTAPQGAPRRGQVTAQTVKRWEDKQAAAGGGKSEGVGADLVTRLTALAAAGKTSPQIAQELGVTSKRVRAVAKRQGIALTPHSQRPEGAAELAPSWAQAYADGQTYKQIADASGHSADTVRRELRSLGVKGRQPASNAEWVAQAIELYQRGATFGEIAKVVGRAENGVYNRLYERGVLRKAAPAKPAPAPAPTAPKRTRKPAWRDRAVELAATMTAAEIGACLGQTPHEVRKVLRKRGVSARSAYEITPEVLEEMISLYATHGLAQIAKKVGRSLLLVRRALEDAGVPIRAPGVNPSKASQETP